MWWLFFAFVDDKTERRSAINVYIVATLDKDTQKKNIKLLTFCIHFRCWNAKKSRNKNPHIQINKKKPKLCIWITCFYDFAWCGYSRFFTLYFAIERKNANEIGQEKDVCIAIFCAQSYKFVRCKAINHQNNLQNRNKLMHFLFFFYTGLARQVANYLDYDETRERERKKEQCNICVALRCAAALQFIHI